MNRAAANARHLAEIRLAPLPFMGRPGRVLRPVAAILLSASRMLDARLFAMLDALEANPILVRSRLELDAQKVAA